MESSILRKREEVKSRKGEASKKKEGSLLKRSVAGAKRQFYLSLTFLRKCSKPSRKEYLQLLRAHALGVAFLGLLGYTITFIHIPINNILVGVKK